jgi:hypothetical protein
MIFSDKIYKIIDGQNATLFARNENVLNLYIFNKTLKKYEISLKDNKNCVFINEHNYEKIIQLNNNHYCICSNDYLTVINETEL